MDLVTTVLTISTPAWVTGGLGILVAASAFNQVKLARRLSLLDRDIDGINEWADSVDAHIKRLDWIRPRRDAVLAANDTVPWWRKRTG